MSPRGPGAHAGVRVRVLFTLLVVREVASLAGAGEGNDARFVEIPLEEPASSDGSRALKERAPGALAWETGRVPSSPRRPDPRGVAAATEREENEEEAEAEAPASREPAKEDDENETDRPAAKKKSHRARVRLPLPAIGGGFHVASGHVLDAHGEVMGASAVSANDTESAATTNVSFAPANPLLAPNKDARTKALQTRRTRRAETRLKTKTVFAPDEETTSVAAGGLGAPGRELPRAEDALDLDGPAVSWGLDFKVADAACCEGVQKRAKRKRMQLVGVLPR